MCLKNIILSIKKMINEYKNCTYSPDYDRTYTYKII